MAGRLPARARSPASCSLPSSSPRSPSWRCCCRLAGPAEAQRPKPQQRQTHQVHKKQVHKKRCTRSRCTRSSRRTRSRRARRPGSPARPWVRRRAATSSPPTSYFSFPNRSKAESVAIRKRVLLSIQSTWGGPRTRAGTPLRHQRDDPHRHLVLRRLGHRQGAGRRAQARCQRPGDRGQGRQQAEPPRLALVARAPRPAALSSPTARRRATSSASPASAGAPAGVRAGRRTRSTSCSTTSARSTAAR